MKYDVFYCRPYGLQRVTDEGIPQILIDSQFTIGYWEVLRKTMYLAFFVYRTFRSKSDYDFQLNKINIASPLYTFTSYVLYHVRTGSVSTGRSLVSSVV